MQERDKDVADKPSRARGGEGGGHVDEVLGQAERSGTQGRQHMSQKSTEFSKEAQRRTDEAIQRSATGMEHAAQNVREGAERASGMQTRAAERMADSMERTAGYLREKDTQQMVDDIERYVREHPFRTIAGALVGGFVLARILR